MHANLVGDFPNIKRMSVKSKWHKLCDNYKQYIDNQNQTGKVLTIKIMLNFYVFLSYCTLAGAGPSKFVYGPDMDEAMKNAKSASFDVEDVDSGR